MREVLATLQAFEASCAGVFDRLGAACSQADGRLAALEARLAAASDRLEAARGSSRPLVVRSARSFPGRAGAVAPPARRVLDEATLHGIAGAAPLCDGGAAAPPSASEAAQGLARMVRCRGGASSSSAPPPPPSGVGAGGLLPPRGRVESAADLVVFNSGVQAYASRRPEVGMDNLAQPFVYQDDQQPSLARVPARARGDVQGSLHLDEDEPDPADQDQSLDFVPRQPDKVTLDLPDVLPDLGGPVADVVWDPSQQAAWDLPPVAAAPRAAPRAPAPPRWRTVPARPAPAPAQARREAPSASQRPAEAPPLEPPSASSQRAAPLPAAPRLLPPPPAPAAAAPAAAAPAPAPAALAEPAASRPAPPKPPGPAGKGKGKGKGGAPPPPKPPGPPPKGAGAKPAPPKKAGGGGGGKAALFAAIGKGAALKKVGAPKERSGVPLGRVAG